MAWSAWWSRKWSPAPEGWVATTCSTGNVNRLYCLTLPLGTFHDAKLLTVQKPQMPMGWVGVELTVLSKLVLLVLVINQSRLWTCILWEWRDRRWVSGQQATLIKNDVVPQFEWVWRNAARKPKVWNPSYVHKKGIDENAGWPGIRVECRPCAWWF